MVSSTSQIFVLAALASTVMEEFAINRFQIGMLGAANTLSGAFTAPFSGRAVDRFGPRRSVQLVLVLSAIGYFLTAAAPSFWLLIAASVFGGLPQGAGNPATNKLIGVESPEGRRGVVTGIKQSGVQLGVVISGGLIPGSAALVGWRWAVASLGVVTLGIAFYARARFPEESTTSASGETVQAKAHTPTTLDPRTKKTVYAIAAYSTLLGFTAGGVTRFLPLFAEEVLGFTESTAGLVLALSGLLAIGARLLWGRLAEHRIGTAPALIILGLGSSLVCWLLLANDAVGAWLIWVIAIVTAFSISAWNVVAMLAVIKDVPLEASGRASGIVLFGFLGGLSIGSPIVGALVDATGSYQSSWIMLGVAALMGVGVMVPEFRRATSE